MLRQGCRVLKSNIIEVNLVLQLDAESALAVRRVPHLGLSLDHFEDECSQCFGSDKTLNVGQGSNQADKSCDERYEH